MLLAGAARYPLPPFLRSVNQSITYLLAYSMSSLRHSFTDSVKDACNPWAGNERKCMVFVCSSRSQRPAFLSSRQDARHCCLPACLRNYSLCYRTAPSSWPPIRLRRWLDPQKEIETTAMIDIPSLLNYSSSNSTHLVGVSFCQFQVFQECRWRAVPYWGADIRPHPHPHPHPQFPLFFEAIVVSVEVYCH